MFSLTLLANAPYVSPRGQPERGGACCPCGLVAFMNLVACAHVQICCFILVLNAVAHLTSPLLVAAPAGIPAGNASPHVSQNLFSMGCLALYCLIFCSMLVAVVGHTCPFHVLTMPPWHSTTQLVCARRMEWTPSGQSICGVCCYSSAMIEQQLCKELISPVLFFL